MPENPNKSENAWRALKRSGQITWLAPTVIVSFVVAGATILKSQGFDTTAALYIGLPVIVAVSVSAVSVGGTVTANALKFLIIAMCLSIPILKEGFICVLMAAPVMLVAVGIVTVPVDLLIRRRRNKKPGKVVCTGLVAVLAVLSMEGTVWFPAGNRHVVQVTRIVNTEPQSIRDVLAGVPALTKPLPMFLRVFPAPVSMSGSGLDVGSQRRLRFEYVKWPGLDPLVGETVFEVVEANERSVTFRPLRDTSYVANYIDWVGSDVSWESVGANRSKVTWQLEFDRKLTPSWYFGPLQDYAARLAAGVLIDHLTPGALEHDG